MKKELIDVYRRKAVQRADYWIFETPILAKRAVELQRFPCERVSVVPMAPSSFIDPNLVDPEVAARFESKLPEGYRVLLLCGPHPNKRLHLVPAIAAELRRRHCGRIKFVLTVPVEDRYARGIFSAAEMLGVHDAIVNIGPIATQEVPSLIARCDAMATLSVLESFSNNFVEAWRMERPLIVTDADWARDACSAAAMYINPENAVQCAATFMKLLDEPTCAERLILAGRRQLALMPDAKMKTVQYLHVIERASELGMCSESERRLIHWNRIA